MSQKKKIFIILTIQIAVFFANWARADHPYFSRPAGDDIGGTGCTKRKRGYSFPRTGTMGLSISGSAIRIQGGEEIEVGPGDFWCSPGHVEHGIIGGAGR